jgi:hypothetical protein
MRRAWCAGPGSMRMLTPRRFTERPTRAPGRRTTIARCRSIGETHSFRPAPRRGPHMRWRLRTPQRAPMHSSSRGPLASESLRRTHLLPSVRPVNEREAA